VQRTSRFKQDATIANPIVEIHAPFTGTLVSGSNSAKIYGRRPSSASDLITLACPIILDRITANSPNKAAIVITYVIHFIP
jgi:hypothetical protein